MQPVHVTSCNRLSPHIAAAGATTEAHAPEAVGLERRSDAAILAALMADQEAAGLAVRAALGALERAAVDIVARLRLGGRLIYAGAGTSGRLAAQDGAELMPTFGWPAARLGLVLAGGPAALVRSVEGAEDDATAGGAAIDRENVGGRDVLIAVAASGRTPFTLAAKAKAARRGALIVALANDPKTPLLADADHPICLATGTEVIAGSTRLKAGTAQKMALGILSSLVMIRLGRVHDGMMVDMAVANAKLEDRALRMVERIAGCSRATARDSLSLADGHIKLAVLIAHGVSRRAAQHLLACNSDHLGPALTELAVPEKPNEPEPVSSGVWASTSGGAACCGGGGARTAHMFG